MTEKIDVPICQECYDMHHFTGGIWCNARQEDDEKCSYCGKITNHKTVGYKVNLKSKPCL